MPGIYAQHEEHAEEEILACRSGQQESVRAHLYAEAFNRECRRLYNADFDLLYSLNPVYMDAMIFLIGDDICRGRLQPDRVGERALEYIRTHRGDLLFARNELPGTEKQLGKYIYEGDPKSTVFPMAAGDPCTNAGFEQNSYTGWQTLCGMTNGTMYTVVNPVSYTPGNNAPCNNTPQHTIFTGGNDPVVPSMPCVNPNGGSASVRIGDGTGINAHGAVLRQTFMVSSASTAFSYSYAAVMEDPGHVPSNQPFFKALIYDQNNNPITCSQYQAYAGDGQNGWVNMGAYLYKNWTTTFIDLTPYVGQNVTIEFSVGDCSQTGHYAYAYVQAACSSIDLVTSAPAICSGQPVTITAPASAQNYLWNTGETTASIIAYAPGTYTVNLTPFQGAQCAMNLSVTVPAGTAPTADFTYSNTQLCVNDTIFFHNTSVLPGTDSVSSVSWSFGDGISVPAGLGPVSGVTRTGGTHTDPSHYYIAQGNYTVTMILTSSNGCKATRTKNMQVLVSPVVQAGNDQQKCVGQPVTLNATGAVSYTWSNGISNNVPFTPPAGQHLYVVTGVGPTGCTDQDTVMVNVDPGPAVFAGNDTAICSGNSLVLSAVTQAANFSWNNGVQNGVAFVPAASNFYVLSASSPGGCTGRDTVYVTVNSLPPVNAGPDVMVCEQDNVTLTAGGAAQFQWNNGVQNGIPFVPAPGSTYYTVTGTDANGCSASDSLLLTVIATPVLNAGNDTSVCAGSSLVLSATGTAPSFSWNNGVQDGVPFTPVASQVYVVSYTSPQGCNAADSVQVTVNPLPLADAGEDLTMCAGAAFVPAAAGNAAQYTWSNGLTDNTPVYPAAGTYTYVLTGTSATGCITYDTIVVTVHSVPQVNAGNDQAVCAGGTVTLSASGSGAPFVWDNGVQNGVPFNATHTQMYIVQTQPLNGCTGYDTVWVTVHPLPLADAGEDIIVCENTPVVLTAVPAGTGSWTGGVQDGIPFVQVPGTQQYVVSVTDSNNCSASDSVLVTVLTIPDAQIGADPVEGPAPLDVTFTGNSTGTSTTFDWDFGNGMHSSETGPFVHTYTQAGEYTAILTVSNGPCSDTASVLILVKNAPPLGYNIPNVFSPNGDGSNDLYHFSLENAEYVKAYIYNRWGELVAEYNEVSGGWNGNVLSGGIASPGVYYVVYEIKGLDGALVKGDVFVHLFY